MKRDKHMRAYSRVATILSVLILVVVIGGIGLHLQKDSSATTPTTRNKYLWPFAQNSPWNMPVGSKAVYQHAGLSPALAHRDKIVTTDKIHISVDKTDPIKLLNSTYKVHVDQNLSHNGSWNGIGVLLREGGNTVAEGQTLYLTAGGNPSWEHKYGYDNDLKGNGIRGAHGGSAMSGLGGTIREHEWRSTEPYRHALAINLFGVRFMSTANNGYRWPATKADRGYDVYDTTVPTNYYGRTGKGYDFMGMGTLLALKPDYNVAAISDPQARRIAQALKDYGGYVVDNTAWDVHALSVEHTVNSEFRNAGTAFHSQLMGVFSNLHAITNNTATSVGGGGTPRVPLAPCFDDESTCTTATSPTPLPAPVLVSQTNNLASGKTFASSVPDASATYAAAKANDKDEATRWISSAADNAALSTDLGATHTLSKVSILWAGNTTKSYDIQLSSDNITWRTVSSGVTDNTASQLINTSAFTSTPTGRYFRIVAKDRWNTTFGNSIYEIGIYGSLGTGADTTAPAVSLTAPTAGATISGTYTMAATASDNTGVAKVEFLVDGNIKNTDTTSPYSFSLDTTALSNGGHNFTAKAYDAAGNSTTSAIVSATIQNAVAAQISQTGNLVSKKIFTSSTGAVNGYPLSNINNGIESDRWISNALSNVSISTDLGASYVLSKVSVLWAANTTRGYDIQMSHDNVTWKTIASGSTDGSSQQLINTTSFSVSPSGRYLRILAKDRWNDTFGNSIFELGAYGTPNTTTILSGDVNGDNRINAVDLSILLTKDGQNYPPADFNGDGVVGAADMAIMLSKWTW